MTKRVRNEGWVEKEAFRLVGSVSRPSQYFLEVESALRRAYNRALKDAAEELARMKKNLVAGNERSDGAYVFAFRAGRNILSLRLKGRKGAGKV